MAQQRIPDSKSKEVITDGTAASYEGGVSTSVTSGSYQTIESGSGSVRYDGYLILGPRPGFRLTVDGTVVMDQGGTIGTPQGDIDDGSTTFGAAFIPPFKAESSYEVEVYNGHSASAVYGYQKVQID